MQIHDTVVSPLHWAVKDGKLDMARVSIEWRSSRTVGAFGHFETARNLSADGQAVKGALLGLATRPTPSLFPWEVFLSSEKTMT